jgi:hypothetical protein
MYYFAGLIIIALAIDLLAVRKVWGTDGSPVVPKPPMPSAPQPAPREYLAAEIRVMDKEARYRKELRAAQMGYCLLPRQSDIREFPRGEHA